MNGFLRLRNSNIDDLHEDYVNLKLHMERKIQELEDTDGRNWSKHQLSLAAEREWILKQSKMQTELNWQQVCENAECSWYQKSEDLTHSLSSSREEIFQYGDESSLCKDTPSLEIKKLQEQNANLRTAIAQMRKEMESLDEQMLSSLTLTEDRQLAEQGLWHPASSKHCTVCIASGSLLPRELIRRMQCQLSVLKHLQHRLSAQVRLDFSIENHGPDTFSAIKADTCTKTQTQLLSQSPSQDQQVQLSSSRAHNLCPILDPGSSLSLQSPRKNRSQVEFEVVHSIEQSEECRQSVKAKDKLEMSAEDLTVRGTRLEVQQKLKSRSLSCPHLLKPKIFSTMAKIRNYNIKD